MAIAATASRSALLTLVEAERPLDRHVVHADPLGDGRVRHLPRGDVDSGT
jgi:hypothetical protein